MAMVALEVNYQTKDHLRLKNLIFGCVVPRQFGKNYIHRFRPNSASWFKRTMRYESERKALCIYTFLWLQHWNWKLQVLKVRLLERTLRATTLPYFSFIRHWLASIQVLLFWRCVAVGLWDIEQRLELPSKLGLRFAQQCLAESPYF